MNRDLHFHFYAKDYERKQSKPKPVTYVYVAKNILYTNALDSIIYSNNGSDWSNISKGGFDVAVRKIVYSSNFWVAAGVSRISTINTLQYSKTGSNWSNASTGGFDTKYATDVVYNATKKQWVATGNGGNSTNTIQYSGNGSNWSNIVSGGFYGNYSGTGNAVAYNGSNLYVATGGGTQSTNTIQYSRECSNWSNIVNSGGFNGNYGNGTGNAVVYNTTKKQWIATGDGDSVSNSIQYSGDGSNWSNIVSGGFANYGNYTGNTIAYDGKNLCVALGIATDISACIQYSGNGSNWSNSSYNLCNIVPMNILYTGSNFLIQCDNNVLLSSTNGNTWKSVMEVPYGITKK